MKGIMARKSALICGALAICCICAGCPAIGQARRAEVGNTASALLLSDIHFDPFHDPDKVARLVNAPASEWEAILAEPASVDQSAAFAALQQRCNARGVDTSYELFRSSLLAERREARDAKFITLSGDLIAHGFGCRFAALVPGKTPRDYSAFVDKTVEYVTSQLRKTFPEVPVYAALGNNDSGCGDYRLDGASDFLTATAKNVMAGLPNSADRKKAQGDFTTGGYYSVMMAAPMRNTRLIVLDDIFMSQKYETCGGQRDAAAAAAQIAWLQRQFADARRQKQRVWVMGHVPPVVDIYSTFTKMRNVCANDKPEMFLASDQLGDALVENADVIRLGLFAHTHMDELRLLEPEGNTKEGGAVAIKMVSSISPVNGNNPSFTVARIDTAAATLTDYQVFAASNLTGVNAAWSKEYDYAQTYRKTAFTAATVKTLIAEFRADPDAKTDASRSYIDNFFVGDHSSLIKPLWPEYVCALSHYTAAEFDRCVCAGNK
ncbi:MULTISPECIES: metallophosphoesterase [Acidobacteriaceae]|uniref:metallophosphoesterase n=1 Tax=Acidobacteriaceae TaxID=204434 RepID=UPI00131CD3C4|nr:MULTISPECIES: metallophosphoesterase [Acidobacteriaceae]MDW5267380.1 metallophosphoesterase [Edaphobacter sp.]